MCIIIYSGFSVQREPSLFRFLSTYLFYLLFFSLCAECAKTIKRRLASNKKAIIGIVISHLIFGIFFFFLGKES